MRYVSEKKLTGYLSRVNRESSNSDKGTYYYEGHADAIRAILSMVEELPDEQTKPMCEAPSGVPILVDTGDGLREAFVSKKGVVIFSDCDLLDAHALGWREI